jgi:hypothetical protein
MLAWAGVGHGCDWDEDYCLRDVVARGQLEVLQWMREHEGVWDERICQHAARIRRTGGVAVAKSNNCPGAENY